MKIKLHAFLGNDNGTASCDFRGEKFIGAAEGDQHRTIAELDNPDPETVDMVLVEGPKLNALLNSMTSSIALEGLGHVGLRLGVWPDEDNKTSS